MDLLHLLISIGTLIGVGILLFGISGSASGWTFWRFKVEAKDAPINRWRFRLQGRVTQNAPNPVYYVPAQDRSGGENLFRVYQNPNGLQVQLHGSEQFPADEPSPLSSIQSAEVGIEIVTQDPNTGADVLSYAVFTVAPGGTLAAVDVRVLSGTLGFLAEAWPYYFDTNGGSMTKAGTAVTQNFTLGAMPDP